MKICTEVYLPHHAALNQLSARPISDSARKDLDRRAMRIIQILMSTRQVARHSLLIGNIRLDRLVPVNFVSIPVKPAALRASKPMRMEDFKRSGRFFAPRS